MRSHLRRSYPRWLARAVLPLCLVASVNAASPAATAPVWVEFGADGTLSVRAVVMPGAACPPVAADGAAVPSLVRAAPDDAFPVQICDARVPPATARLPPAGLALPVL